MKKLYTLNNEFIKEVAEEDIPENFTGIIEFSSRTKYWLVNGKRHREDGPASEWSNGTKSWWFNGPFNNTDIYSLEASHDENGANLIQHDVEVKQNPTDRTVLNNWVVRKTYLFR